MDLDEPTSEHFFEGPHLPPLPTTLVPFAAEQIDSIQNAKVSPPEILVVDNIYCVGIVILNLMIHELLERTCSD